LYNRETVARNIHNVQQRTSRPITYYTPDYIAACVEVLDRKAIKDTKGRWTGELTSPLLPDESAFIRNERLLCALDYDHWASNYHKIRDSNTQQMIPFRRNFAQEALNSVYCDLQAQGRPIEIQSLKARQLGITTDSTSRGLHRALFIPNTSGALASSDEDKTWKFIEMMQRSLLGQPWWLVPDDIKEYKSGEVFIESAKRNMTISVQHGRQTSGISRGDTINYYHLSEIPDFDKPKALIDASLLKARHPTPLTFGMLESTANGRNDYWHELWKNNQRRWSSGIGEFCPVFLPWYMGTDIYPTRTWVEVVAPIPTGWNPPEFIINHAQKAREYVLSQRVLWRALGLDWRMPLEQMWFYWVQYSEAKIEGEEALAKFYSEMPANDLEAFQSRHGMVFSIELVQQYQDKAKPPLRVYGLQGEGIPAPLWPESSETTGEIGLRTMYWDSGEDKCYTCTFTPVREPHADGLDRLVVWELPIPGNEYGVSLDGAEGKGLDRTVLTVVRKGTPLSPAEIVAELATDKVATLEIWPVWLALLKLFSPVYSGEYTWALAAPETNRGGDAALMELRKRGYPNIYIRQRPDSRLKLLTPKYGWETTPKSRDQLIQWTLLIVKGQWAQLNSPWLVDELRDFVVNQLQTKIRLEAGAGSHDDRIFAFIICLICLHGIDIYQAETPAWRRVLDDAHELLSFPCSRGLLLPTRDPDDPLEYFTGGASVSYAEADTDIEEGELE